jgi:hypothetical protein
MSARIDLLIKKLPFCPNSNLKEKLPLILRKFIPTTAIICDAQFNEHNQLSWAIIYQDGSDTFIQIAQNDRVYLNGEHEREILDAIKAFISQLQNYGLQQAWFKQLSFQF